MDSYTRFGYSFKVKMTFILERKGFARWQASEKLPDTALCKAVKEMESGLIDADLGGHLYKKRVARPGGGNSGGLPNAVVGPDRQPLRVPAWVPEKRQGEHHAGREEGAAIRQQGISGPVCGRLVESAAGWRVIGGAL